LRVIDPLRWAVLTFALTAATDAAAQGGGDTGEGTSDEHSATTTAGPDPQTPEPGQRVVAFRDAPAGTTLARELDLVAGVDVRSTGSPLAPAWVSIRGATLQQTRVLLNGVPLHGALDTTFDISVLPTELLRSAVVWRGYTPLHAGPPSAGGVLDLQTGRPDRRVTVWAGAGSFGSARAGTTWASPSGDSWLGLSLRTTDGQFKWYDPNGTPFDATDDNPDAARTNNQARDAALTASHRLRLGRWRITGTTLSSYRAAGEPGIASADVREASTRRARAHLAIEASQKRLLNDHLDLSLLAAWDLAWWRFRDPRAELSLLPVDSKDAVHSVLLGVRPAFRVHTSTDILTLVDVSSELYRPFWRTGQSPVNRADRYMIGTGAELVSRLFDERMNVRAGGRMDLAFENAAGADELVADRAQQTALPSTWLALDGALAMGDQLSLHPTASAHYGWRRPGFTERFGNRGTTVGNPALRPERTFAWEAGGALTVRSRGEVRPLQASAEWLIYERYGDDFIVFETNAAGVAIPRNLQRVHIRGQELSLTVQTPWFAMGGTGSLMDAIDRSDDPLAGNRLPWRPVTRANAHLRTGIGPVSAMWRTSWASAVWLDRANTRQLPDRVEHDASLSVEHRPWNLRAELAMYNVTNNRTGTVELPNGGATQRSTQPLSDFLGYPIAGRSLFFSLAWTWGGAT
jgi:outer membrane cobalamin receptor